jgi:hypothetical protein
MHVLERGGRRHKRVQLALDPVEPFGHVGSTPPCIVVARAITGRVAQRAAAGLGMRRLGRQRDKVPAIVLVLADILVAPPPPLLLLLLLLRSGVAMPLHRAVLVCGRDAMCRSRSREIGHQKVIHRRPRARFLLLLLLLFFFFFFVVIVLVVRVGESQRAGEAVHFVGHLPAGMAVGACATPSGCRCHGSAHCTNRRCRHLGGLWLQEGQRIRPLPLKPPRLVTVFFFFVVIIFALLVLFLFGIAIVVGCKRAAGHADHPSVLVLLPLVIVIRLGEHVLCDGW